ncbi:hypothetical protein BURPS668_2125 [Burkholderia pseudomallei 668]|nr:hypothetical protein BURPS668_2125 [Burkholderia pseudomallei 668]
MGAIGAGPVRRNATGRDGHSAVRDAFPIPRPVRAAENARMLERPAAASSVGRRSPARRRDFPPP